MENKECLYNEAIKMIENGDYLGAFNNLRRCKTYKDSKELLCHFETLVEKQISTIYDTNGNVENITEDRYDEYGNVIRTVMYDSKGNLKEEVRSEYINPRVVYKP